MAKISDDAARRIDDHVTKYMDVLQIDGERPVIKVRDNSKAWAGRADRHPERPTTLIELQKKWLSQGAKHDKFTERVVAHEMVHHRNYLAGTEDEKHGPAFREGAARVNAVMGPGFVAEKISPPPSKWMVALGIGGLALLGALLLLKPSARSRMNERGHYG